MKIYGDKFNVSETDEGKLLVQGASINQKEFAPPDVKDPIIVNGAWYLDNFPSVIVVELPDGALRMFYIMPFRVITPKDLREYKSYHPRKMRGQPLPEYLYKFYGLARNEEMLSEVLRVRLSPSELEKVKATADAAGKTVSELIRELVRGL